MAAATSSASACRVRPARSSPKARSSSSAAGSTRARRTTEAHMKSTIIATALTLIVAGALPVAAQTGRADTTAPTKASGSGTTPAAPADAKAAPNSKATADDPKGAAAEPATPVADDPKAADGQAKADVQDPEDDPDLDVNLAQPDY